MKKTFHPRGEGVQEAAFFLRRKRNVCLLCQNWPWDVIWGSSNTLKRNACTAYVIYLSYTSGLKIAIKNSPVCLLFRDKAMEIFCLHFNVASVLHLHLL